MKSATITPLGYALLHYGDGDTVFAQRLGTMEAAIQRALPQNPTAIYVEKGCHCIETSNGRPLHKWDLVESIRIYNFIMCFVRTTGF